jgi:hypothetical protein
MLESLRAAFRGMSVAKDRFRTQRAKEAIE